MLLVTGGKEATIAQAVIQYVMILVTQSSQNTAQIVTQHGIQHIVSKSIVSQKSNAKTMSNKSNKFTSGQ